MDTKSASIVAQTAAKVAAQIFTGTGDTGGYLAAIEAVHSDLVSRQVKGVVADISQQPQTMQQATQNVVQAFPQAQPVTQFDPWQDLLQHPDQWWDNRDQGDTTISGGSRPDFRHKTLKDDQGRPKALFMVDNKWGKHAPPNVFAHYGHPYPGQQPQQQQAVNAAPVPPPPAPF